MKNSLKLIQSTARVPSGLRRSFPTGRSVAATIGLALLLQTLPLFALAPQAITFQGRIAVAGQPFNGNGQFKFAILANNGAVQLWNSEGSTNAEPAVWVNVPVSNGVFTVPLGDVSTPGMAALPAGLFRSYPDTQLRIWFNDGTNGFGQLTPDQKLTTAPYALHAEHADSVPDGSIGASKLAQGAASANLGSNSIAGWQLAPGAAAGNLTPGSIGSGHLAANAALENLNASGVGYVPQGGIVFSEMELNPQFLAAGFLPLGMSNVLTSNQWVLRESGPPAAGAAESSAARFNHAAAWTGTEMLVYGGYPVRFGLRYNAAGNSWSFMSSTNAPEIDDCEGFWTGNRFVVWSLSKGVGGRYNPSNDTWQTISSVNSPGPRFGAAVAIWTGTEMIVWGGTSLSPGARYNPMTDAWTTMTTNGAPSQRTHATAVWTGSRMLVFGGQDEKGATVLDPCHMPFDPIPAFNHVYPKPLNTGRLYNPANNTWTIIADAPEPRSEHRAVWTGADLIVYGGHTNYYLYCKGEPGTGWGINFNSSVVMGSDPATRGMRYNVAANTWTMLNTNGQPLTHSGFTMTWTGSEAVVFGSGPEGEVAQARYNPALNTWSAVSAAGALSPRSGHTAVWTSTQVILWGGKQGDTELANGARYTPNGSWIALAATPPAFSEPSERFGSASVWTGKEMIVWGGMTSQAQFLRSGGRYNPTSNSWTNMALAGSPSPRANATGLWTGKEMLIWGGNEYFTQQGTGGRYNPASNTWAAISTLNAPRPRSGHVAVWTGSEMLIWGGYYYTNLFDLVYLNDGARYNPASDTWTKMTNTAGTYPAAFSGAVWTGKEMLVVSGLSEVGATPYYMSPIYRYTPTNDAWNLVHTLPVEHRRYNHTVVWTGTELLAWGGRNSTNLNTGFRYNPTTDTWAALPPVIASPRTQHTAVWAGHRMIISGGEGLNSTPLFETLTFDPYVNRWNTAIPTPFARKSHVAVWTGTEMLTALGKDSLGDQNTTMAFRPAKVLHYYQKQ